ncbi:MAG TPA: glycosyltransferase [Solirubrobacterales bacterium]|jgi:glycosyltransferase involved in cell wall biosynthesis
MRVLVVTNMTPDAAAPARGRFVRDQVDALRREGVDVELHSFPVGSRQYPLATWAIRRLIRRQRFDLVHAHYGLAGWCALMAGARPLVVTFHGTDVRHPVVGPLSRRLAPRLDLVAGASRALFANESGRAGLPHVAGASAVLPCGADLDSFAPGSRADARRRLGLDREGRYLLFPASPDRPVKRHDRATQLAELVGAELLSGGGIEAGRMVDWVNAANAVLITSDNEGFGLAAVEALACDVPVLSTPVGIAPTLLGGIHGCLVEPFDPERWAAVARSHLNVADSRIAGRERARWFAAEPMAERVATAYRELLAEAE